jgi:hypothetical protein
MNIQAVIDLARKDLNDDAKVRHADTDLLLFANNFIQEATKLRPDWFFPNDPPAANLALNANLPFSERYARSMADYIIARANLRGTEESRMDMAAAYMQLSASTAGVA